MKASLDALCLIHLGISHRDQRLLDEGRRVHCAALRLVREDIEKPDAISNDSILGACYTIAHCQIYQEISQLGKGWQIHMEGLYYLLRRRGAASISSPFAQAIFHNVRQIGVMHQLVNRKKTFLSSAQWLSSRNEKQQPAFQITNIALKVSELLEDIEFLAAQIKDTDTCPSTDVQGILCRKRGLENALNQWLLDFNNALGSGGSPVILTSISSYPCFEELCGDDGVLIPEVYEFPSLLSATCHCYVWICLLAMQKPFASLLQQLTSSHRGLRLAMFAQDPEEYATHLMRSLAFISLQKHKSAGILACSGPLYWAETWYEYREDVDMVRFCQRLRESLSQQSSTSLDLRHPCFTWWMLPSIFVQ